MICHVVVIITPGSKALRRETDRAALRRALT
jgi:hypothetical protein